MNVTKRKISIKPGGFKRTKIIATIGPATDNYKSIVDLMKAGVNGFRLNFSHNTQESHAKTAKLIRKASREVAKPVAIIQDLQGPKVRLGDFEGVIPVVAGEEIRLGYKSDYERSGVIPTQYDLSKKVKRGHRVYIFDGRIRCHVTSVQQGLVYLKVENDGVLVQRKGINLPDTDFSGSIITAKDKRDIVFGASMDIDFVALSFVQSADDVNNLKRRLAAINSSAKVIAKIETSLAAGDNLESIVEAADGVMVARGDLAYEVGPEAVPVIQSRIVRLGHQFATPTIIATQMLISMVDQPEPTRAEVADVSGAVSLGADCVMLSDETTVGKYPIEAVNTMKRIVRYNEEHAHLQPILKNTGPGRQEAICSAVVALADRVEATAIVAETKSGATAHQIAKHQPVQPIIAVTSDRRVAQQLAILRGTKSFVRSDGPTQGRRLTQWLHDTKVLVKGDMIVSASGQHPGVVGTTDTIKVRVIG